MKSLFLGRLLFAGIIAISSSAVSAEKLDYQQCVAKALAQNPDLAISQAQIEQAQAAVRQASGKRLPQLNLSLTATRSNDALNAFGMKLGQRNATFGDFGAGEFNGANPSVLSIAPHDPEPPQRRQQLQQPHRTADTGLQRRHGAKLCRYRQGLCACRAGRRRSCAPANRQTCADGLSGRAYRARLHQGRRGGARCRRGVRAHQRQPAQTGHGGEKRCAVGQGQSAGHPGQDRRSAQCRSRSAEPVGLADGHVAGPAAGCRRTGDAGNVARRTGRAARPGA
jgi:hypothetical protein